eukprot:TRINITY_DN2407_c0_g1_i1.p1 TRINITY_DN2407_c0_g1~~TRINITY_DN2407_c0_g1_i1.p1  ORF type:complete len:176 (-),score=2.78 TRINITY_DN2407_c0_g1_i1:463-990(-)
MRHKSVFLLCFFLSLLVAITHGQPLCRVANEVRQVSPGSFSGKMCHIFDAEKGPASVHDVPMNVKYNVFTNDYSRIRVYLASGPMCLAPSTSNVLTANFSYALGPSCASVFGVDYCIANQTWTVANPACLLVTCVTSPGPCNVVFNVEFSSSLALLSFWQSSLSCLLLLVLLVLV